jgi:hypothetical protein
MNNGEDLIRYQPGRTLTPVMDLTLAKARLAEFQRFVDDYMVKDEDYGQIPGTPKPTLYKPGADKLCELYGLSDSYKILNRMVDFESGLFDYEIECELSRDGIVVATGLGCCSSFEGKYRWRDSKRICPQCQKDTIIKGKEEYGGGWLCYKKTGGCGAKFNEDDPAIMDQVIGRVENDDLATIKNTVFKIAKKRAKIDATLSATRSAGRFTQDVGDSDEKKKQSAPIQQPQRKSESGTAPANGAKLISEGQVKRLWAKGYASVPGVRQSLEQTQINNIVAAFGYKHANEIKTSDYDAIIAAIEKGEVPTSDPDPTQ